MTFSLTLIRHGPVVNKDGIVYGDEAELDLTGMESRLDELAQALPDPGRALWLSSGIPRAHLSALAVLRRKGLEDFDLPVLRGLKDQDFGNLEGERHEDVPEHVSLLSGRIYAPNPPGGESVSEMISRMRHTLKDISALAASKNHDRVIAFCHGGIIRAMKVIADNLDESRFIDYETPYLSDHTFEVCLSAK